MSHQSPTTFRALQTSLVNPQTEGFVSVNASDPLAIDISGYRAQFLAPGTSNIVVRDYPDKIGVSVPAVVGDLLFFVYVDINGDVSFTPQEQSGSFYREHIEVGIITVDDTATFVNSVSSNTRASVKNALMFFTDHAVAIGPTSTATGNRAPVTGSVGRNSVDIGEGEYFGHALNARDDEESPNTRVTAAILGGSQFMFQVWNLSGGGSSLNTGLDIPAGVYDDGTAISSDTEPQGVVGEFEWVNHRLHHVVDTNILAIQFGQFKYTSKLAAQIGLRTENYLITNLYKGNAPKGVITMRGGSTGFSDPCNFGYAEAVGGRTGFV